MELRTATIADIPAMHEIRISVKENRLSDPARITHNDYREYLTERGKGWVQLAGEIIVGFAIVSIHDHNVWALFVHPDQEGRGYGKALHDTMVGWYFSKTSSPLWLTTSPSTRAEQFYTRLGWINEGMQDGEVRFVRYAS